ncbi:MAG: transposase [Proteobacteria bacterium]|nr:transposase [Pseudomonadota bacterium]
MDAASDVSDARAGERGTRQRQYRSAEQKREIVQETLKPGASVAVVARRHGVNANQLFSWRRQYYKGVLEVSAETIPQSALVPITLTQSESTDTPPGKTGTNSADAHIDIEFAGGRRVSVWGRADLPTLCAILQEFCRT